MNHLATPPGCLPCDPVLCEASPRMGDFVGNMPEYTTCPACIALMSAEMLAQRADGIAFAAKAKAALERREQGMAALLATGIQATDAQRELALAELLEDVAFPSEFPAIAAAILQRVVDRQDFFTGPEPATPEVLAASVKAERVMLPKAKRPSGLARHRRYGL